MSQQDKGVFMGNEFDSVMAGQTNESPDTDVPRNEPGKKPSKAKKEKAEGQSKAAKLRKPLIVVGVIAVALVGAGTYKRMTSQSVELTPDVMDVMARAQGNIPPPSQLEPAEVPAWLTPDAETSVPEEEANPAQEQEAPEPVAPAVAAKAPASEAPAQESSATAPKPGIVATVAHPEAEAEVTRLKRELQQQRNRAAQAEARARAAASSSAPSYTVTAVLNDGVVVRDSTGKEHVIAVGGRIGK